MRALPFLAAAVLILVRSGQADAQQFGYGLKGGPQLSLTRSALVRYDPVPGAAIGLYFPLGFAKSLEVQPELLVSLQGAAYSDPERDARWTTRQLYVQLPVMAKWFFTNTFNIQLGVQAGYLLLARNELNGETRLVTDTYRKLDLGPALGFGLEMRNGTDLGLRYYNGLTATLVNDRSIYPRNNTVLLSVGKRFRKFSRNALVRKRR